MAPRLTFKQKVKNRGQQIFPRKVIRYIYRQRALKYIDSINSEFDPHKKTILALNHLFDQDLLALANANTRYNLIILEATGINKGSRFYFSQESLLLLKPYHAEPEKNRTLWRKECQLMFDRIWDRFHPELFLVPSDAYIFIREFIEVVRERGIPTVMIDKEGNISPSCIDAYAARLREYVPPLSDHIYVWSDRQMRYWNRAGVSSDRITILGQPRSDLFFAEERNDTSAYFPKSQPLITFFSYMDDAYIFPQIFPELAEEGLSWQAMKRETHEEIFRLATKFKNYNFVIKTHPQQPDFHELKEKYQSDNLVVIGGPKVANELIQRSELIIAFQTTALIESMFMNKPSIYTCWDKNYDQLIRHCIPFHDAKGIVIPDSFPKFVEACEKFLSGDRSDFDFSEQEIAEKNQFVEEYFYRPDGQVCRRFFEAVGRHIK